MDKEQIRNKTSKPLLWIGMASIGMAFAGLTSGYVVSKSSIATPAARPTIPLRNESLFSTTSIVISSALLIMAMNRLKVEKYKSSNLMIWFAFVFGCAFLYTQVLGWNDLMKNQGVFFTGEQSRPAGSWLYVITWFHWIHALAGVIVLLVASIRSSKGFFNEGNILQFKLSSQFWHFLGFLWIYLLLFLTFLR